VPNELPLDRDDVVTMMGALFVIRTELRFSSGFSRETMKRKRRKRTPEERAAAEARYQETTRKLQERIEYHTAKLEEEHRAASGES
jgi:hypothetical protein